MATMKVATLSWVMHLDSQTGWINHRSQPQLMGLRNPLITTRKRRKKSLRSLPRAVVMTTKSTESVPKKVML